MAGRMVRRRLQVASDGRALKRPREHHPVRPRRPHERGHAREVAGERRLDQAQLVHAQVQVRVAVGRVGDVIVDARQPGVDAAGAGLPAGRRGVVRRHRRLGADAVFGREMYVWRRLASSLVIDSACTARRSFWLRGDQRAQPREIAAHEVQHALLLRQQLLHVRARRQHVAEHPPEHVERLDLGVERPARERDVALPRDRRPVRHHARRDLVAVRADVRRELQRTVRGLVGLRRAAQQRRRSSRI